MAKAKRKRASNPISRAFASFAGAISRIAGRPYVFILCVLVVILWAATGPVAGFSDTWQLIINTSTTIITFLMVFLIQNTQNRDNAAIQAKLDELIRVGDSQNKFIGIEHLTDEELDAILEEVEQYAEHLHAERRSRPATRDQPNEKRRKAHAERT
jgi:low affinity Fe/Cu permease